MSARIIPDVVTQVQIEASDPAVSAWVSANAGSGKTHVLAQRVIRLLLDGVDPAAILCITFTKAAAANMAKRVYDTLAAWTALDDAALDTEIRKTSRRAPDAILRATARRLFARALETPGGLKVQTIHAFCTRVLHQFPFEANVAARFAVMDDTQQREMLERLSLGVLLDAAARPDSAVGRALANAVAQAADQTFKDVIGEAIALRERLSAWIAAAGGVAAAIDQLGAVLGVALGDTLAAIDAEIIDGALLPISEWESVAATLTQGSKTDTEQGALLRRARAAADAERAALYTQIFLTKEQTPRKRLVTKALAEAYPDLCQRLTDEQARLVDLVARRRAVFCRDKSAALIAVAETVISRYRAEKDHRGLLDYDDLIEKTRALLANVDSAWVHYKLDLGIDHVLIDEAQDTSPAQWDIIKRIVAEFFAGAGARASVKRTIFAVGDEKQSIFSFQGAQPDAFADSRQHFGRLHRDSALEFRPLEFKHSFRSGPSVLGAVDIVFQAQSVFAGVTSDSIMPTHAALEDAAPGLVEVWPLARPDERPEKEGWEAPFDKTSETSPAVKLARRIAGEIKRLLDAPTPIGTARKLLTPGDVLILVSRRGALFEAIIRALKNADIPVAGADRLVLTEHIAVMDLIVLADALLLPHDDLALATVLKSPLFGCDDDDLFRLAWLRPGTLRAALAAHAGESEKFAAADQKLVALARLARNETPFGFYAHLLGPMHGRRQFAARLGAEANDAIDEFLNLALDHEKRETPTLQNFVAWLRAARAEVKRDMEIARDEVRVMTVHGAKGLEAPVVILADTTAPPAGHASHQARLVPLPRAGVAPGTPDCLAWIGKAADDIAPLADARGRAKRDTENEYRRLLYVAMTRAAERLIVCGVEGDKQRPPGCWYDLVHDALAPLAETVETEDGTLLRYRKAPDVAPADEAAAPAPVAATRIVLPPWLTGDVPAEPRRPAPLAPSRAFDEEMAARTGAANGEASEARRLALARGRVIHRLLQSLPDLPPDRRLAAARAHLVRSDKEFPTSAHERCLAEIFAVLADSRFAPLFGPGSRAEVSLVGRIERHGRTPLLVSGQIDRLAVTADAVLIADFKTDRAPPLRLDDVPPAYVAQLALYRAVVAQLYPGRAVRAALIWTDVPDLMELLPDALDRALAALTTP